MSPFLFAIPLLGCTPVASVPVQALDAVRSGIPEVQAGDLIFQQSKSSQSEAIGLATGSRYTHMGVLFRHQGELVVFEAIQPVSMTPLDRWTSRGVDGHYVVKRLANSEEVFTVDVQAGMLQVGKEFLGKPYDLQFGWDDERLYCSELVFKVYERGADIQIGELSTLRSFDLSHPVVEQKLKERYGKQVPLDEPVISPQSMFESSNLVLVVDYPGD